MIIKKHGKFRVYEFSCKFCGAEWEADIRDCDADIIFGTTYARMYCPECNFGNPIGEETDRYNVAEDAE